MTAIISIHAPKAAGSTLLALFRQIYGEEAVLMDYADDPGNPAAASSLDPQGWLDQRPIDLPVGIRVVHGHFHASKYDLLRDTFRMTFLRHPVDNLVSIYCYWRKIPPQPSPLHQYFLAQKLDVLELARLPLLRTLYSRTYFGGWDMEQLDFVGRYESRTDDLHRLGAMLGEVFNPELHLNQTTGGGHDSERKALMADVKLMAQLTDMLAEDIRFYEACTA